MTRPYWESCGISVLIPKVLLNTPTRPQTLTITNKLIIPHIMYVLPFLRFSSLSGFRKYWTIPQIKPAVAKVNKKGIIYTISVQLAQLNIWPIESILVSVATHVAAEAKNGVKLAIPISERIFFKEQFPSGKVCPVLNLSGPLVFILSKMQSACLLSLRCSSIEKKD